MQQSSTRTSHRVHTPTPSRATPARLVVLAVGAACCACGSGSVEPSNGDVADAGRVLASRGGAGGVAAVEHAEGSGAGGVGATADVGSGPSEDGGATPVVELAEDAGPIRLEVNGGAAGRCDVTASTIECHSKPVVTVTSGADARPVFWNVPAGDAPPAGWPAVVLYQGSFFGPSLTWDVSLARGTTPFGGDRQVELVASLFDAGFVVVQPEAQGGLFWTTNNGTPYDLTADATFIPKLLDEMASGTFGSIDMESLYATGISSGGYMTSRMAVSYPGRFRALAIESGSYATCLGPICSVPADLPADHPPTLFLHGGADTTVPIATAQDYYEKLQGNGIETDFLEDPAAGHEWIVGSPDEVVSWFLTH